MEGCYPDRDAIVCVICLFISGWRRMAETFYAVRFVILITKNDCGLSLWKNFEMIFLEPV